MKIDISKIIESHYHFQVRKISEAPRQFVAQTFIVDTKSGRKLFCKFVDKPIFIPKIIDSLPVLDAISATGFSRIAYPIKTLAGTFFVRSGKAIIILFDYIDAPQNYDYDNFSFGKLIGDVHKLTPTINVLIKKEIFDFQYKDVFEKQFRGTLERKIDQPIHKQLQRLLRKHEQEIESHYLYFKKLIDICKGMEFDYVLTHGDAPGNTLVKTPHDLYLIDWDEILLAPPERDLWFLDQKQDFISGYKSVFPDYQPNEYARAFSILNRHFNDLVEYFAEILGEHKEEHQLKNVEKLSNHLTGWIKPHIDRVIAAQLVL